MAGKFVDSRHLGAETIRLAKDWHFRPLIENLSAQRVFRLKARNQDGITRIGNRIAQMVDHATGFAHATGRDDDHGAAEIIERLGIGNIANIAKPGKPERIAFGIFAKYFCRLGIEKIAVLAKDRGDVDGERRIDEYGNAGDSIGHHQLVEEQNQLLRAPDSEGGNDNFSTPRGSTIDNAGKLIEDRALILMQAVAIGGFHDEVVAGEHRLRVANNWQVRTADIAGESNSRCSIA